MSNQSNLFDLADDEGGLEAAAPEHEAGTEPEPASEAEPTPEAEREPAPEPEPTPEPEPAPSPSKPPKRYEPLYLRYRPTRFEDLIGQEHVALALRKATQNNKIGNVYLFSGPRGTGKTSTARILAQAANCLTPESSGEPCGDCSSCVEFAQGTSLALHELDAATNNKTEDIENLLDTVVYAPTGLKKVYVLDEAHMLTSGAETLLLRFFETTPSHTTFVLCTTEPHKVADVLRGWAQRLSFDLVPEPVMETHIRTIAEKAGLEMRDEDVAYAIKDGKGSVRDALSALEQAVSAGSSPKQKSGSEPLLDALLAADLASAYTEVERTLSGGKDPRRLAEELAGELRNIFLAKMGLSLDFLPPSDRQVVAERSGRATPKHITACLEEMGRCLARMRQSSDTRIDLELSVLKLLSVEPEVQKPAPARKTSAPPKPERQQAPQAMTMEEKAEAVGISVETLKRIEKVFPNTSAVPRTRYPHKVISVAATVTRRDATTLEDRREPQEEKKEASQERRKAAQNAAASKQDSLFA